MARTPVVAEKPKREPVPVDEIVIDRLGRTDNQQHQRTPVPPIDEDGYRECARAACTSRFKPKSLNPTHDDVTEFYCSTECATIEFYRKQGMGTPPARVERGVSAGTSKAERVVRQQQRADHEVEKLAKYGPLRVVSEILKEGKGSLRVRFECGHEGSIGSRAKQGRCRKCREARVEATADSVIAHATVHPEKPARSLKKILRTPVLTKEEPVSKPKREPITRKTMKRTPVKPKKGRKT